MPRFRLTETGSLCTERGTKLFFQGFFDGIVALPDLSTVRRQSRLEGRLSVSREDLKEDPMRF